jgi:hypothetical protein
MASVKFAATVPKGLISSEAVLHPKARPRSRPADVDVDSVIRKTPRPHRKDDEGF